MSTTSPTQTATTDVPAVTDTLVADLVAEDLIEEVSIDGMCGVY